MKTILHCQCIILYPFLHHICNILRYTVIICILQKPLRYSASSLLRSAASQGFLFAFYFCLIISVSPHASICSGCRLLVMEQSDSCKAHHHAVLIAGLDYIIVTYGTARLRHIFDAALMRTLDVVAEWEERVGA